MVCPSAKCQDATKVCNRTRVADARLDKVVDHVYDGLPVQFDHRAGPGAATLGRGTAYKVEVLNLPVRSCGAVERDNVLVARPVGS
jgi:hypothetical protein